MSEKSLRNVLASLLILLLLGLSRSAAAGILVVDRPLADAPAVFHYGVIDIQTDQVSWGYSRRPGMRGGGHYLLMSRMSGITDLGQLPAQGEGRYGGFGFVPENGRIYVHPLSSLKSAGTTANRGNIMNALLPDNGNMWKALLPLPYLERALEQVVRHCGMPLVLDGDVEGSDRFPFNPKHNTIALAYTRRAITSGSFGLPTVLEEINRRHFPIVNVARGAWAPMSAEDIPMEALKGDTWYPEILEHRPDLGRGIYSTSRSDGELSVLDMWRSISPSIALGRNALIGAIAPGVEDLADLADDIGFWGLRLAALRVYAQVYGEATRVFVTQAGARILPALGAAAPYAAIAGEVVALGAEAHSIARSGSAYSRARGESGALDAHIAARTHRRPRGWEGSFVGETARNYLHYAVHWSEWRGWW